MILPLLRFPEFEKDGDWEIKTLGNITKVVSIRNKKNKKLPVYSISNKDGFVPQSEQFEGIDSTDRGYDISLYKIINKNTFAYNPARINIGSIGYSGDLDNIIISSLYVCFKTIESIDDIFLWYFFQTNHFKQSVLDSVEGGIRNYLFYDNFSRIDFQNPRLTEQQKIAVCLSSLDEVITAETEKLDLLQDHKKGLLQQLFPAEGETQPKFRFPEFMEDGDWEETTLEEVADYENGKAHEQEISDTGIYKVVNSKFISTNGEVVKFTDSANLMASSGDILMVLSDIPNGKAIAKCFYVEENDTYTVNQRICKITPKDIDNRFLFYIQNRNKYFLAFDDGVKQTNLRKETVLSFPFLKPKDPKEQKKIATCLSAADDLIAAQVQKIEALQEHKKGLLQQLFPNVND